MLFNPSFDAIFESGDTVISVGNPENLKKLEKDLNPDGIDFSRTKRRS